MNCIKKPFDTEQKAEAAKDYHNLQAASKGWKTMKEVYFCEEHKAWHISTMNPKEAKIRLKWLDRHKDGGTQFLKNRNKMWDHYMEICQKKLLLPDGTYRKPTVESHKKLMETLVGTNKHPIMFKYVEMWWQKLPEKSKHYG